MTLMLTGTWSHSSARTQARFSPVFIPLSTLLFLASPPGTRYLSHRPHCLCHSPRASSTYGPMRSSCVASKSRWHVVHLAKSGPYSFGDFCTIRRWQRTPPLLPPSFAAWEAWRKMSVGLYMSRWHLSHAVFLSKGRFLWWHLMQDCSSPNFVMWRLCGKRTSRSSRLPVIINRGMRFDPSGAGTSFCHTLTSRRCPPVGGPTPPSSL